MDNKSVNSTGELKARVSEVLSDIKVRHSSSVKTKFFLVLFGIVITFVVLTIAFNTLFLQQYYTTQKKKTLNECFEYISSLSFGNYTAADSEMSSKLSALEESKNIQVLIINSRFRFFFCSKGYNTLFLPLDDDGMLDERWFRQWLFENYHEEDSVEILSTKPQLGKRYSESLASEYLSLYAKSSKEFDGEKYPFYIIINTPMAAIEDSVAISNRFALIIGVIMLVLGGLLTYFLGNMLTRPILRINSTARKIARLDFSEKLAVTSTDEFGELSNSVNLLSSELETKIRELSLANEQLKLDIDHKDKIDKMRRDLISNVSHDLKTPLSIILGYCEGLQANINDDDKEYYCGVIEDEAVHMSRIVSTLLKLAELESGECTVEKSVFSLTELAHDRMDKISYLMHERQIETKCSFEEDFYVLGDRYKLEDVFNNLLSNALHHSPDGGRVELSLRREGEDVICSVYNLGERIPEENLDLIWESFYKVDKSRSRSYGGSGLGLKIVSTILDTHGAGYSVENTSDGVVFLFRMKTVSPEEYRPEDFEDDE